MCFQFIGFGHFNPSVEAVVNKQVEAGRVEGGVRRGIALFSLKIQHSSFDSEKTAIKCMAATGLKIKSDFVVYYVTTMLCTWTWDASTFDDSLGKAFSQQSFWMSVKTDVVAHDFDDSSNAPICSSTPHQWARLHNTRVMKAYMPCGFNSIRVYHPIARPETITKTDVLLCSTIHNLLTSYNFTHCLIVMYYTPVLF